MPTIHGFALGTQRPGSGGMGEVFIAKRLRPLSGFPAGQPVVIKMAPVEQREWVAALKREADILAHLGTLHSQLFELQGVGIAHIQPLDIPAAGTPIYYAEDVVEGWHETNGPAARAFIALEDVRGISLGKYVSEKRSKRLTDYESCQIALRLTRLLEILQQDGRVLHNDIKPDNIVIGPGASPFKITLVDFGISLQLNEQLQVYPGQHAMAYWGGHDYVSPEKIAGQHKTPGAQLDWRSDLWSLAALLLFMSGRPQLLSRGPDAKFELPPTSVPEPVLSFLRRALDPAPNERHAGWAQVKKDLQQCVKELRGNRGPDPGPAKWTRIAREIWHQRGEYRSRTGAALAGSLCTFAAIAVVAGPGRPWVEDRLGLGGSQSADPRTLAVTPAPQATSTEISTNTPVLSTPGVILIPPTNETIVFNECPMKDGIYTTTATVYVNSIAEACSIDANEFAQFNKVSDPTRPLSAGVTLQWPTPTALPTATPLPTRPPTALPTRPQPAPTPRGPEPIATLRPPRGAL